MKRWVVIRPSQDAKRMSPRGLTALMRRRSNRWPLSNITGVPRLYPTWCPGGRRNEWPHRPRLFATIPPQAPDDCHPPWSNRSASSAGRSIASPLLYAFQPPPIAHAPKSARCAHPLRAQRIQSMDHGRGNRLGMHGFPALSIHFHHHPLSPPADLRRKATQRLNGDIAKQGPRGPVGTPNAFSNRKRQGRDTNP